ncbi:DUF2924 domain-containing protein [Tsuneonella sp. HG249]
MNGLGEELEALQAMPPAALRAEWHKLFRTPAPKLGPDALRRGLAWKMQARVHGGLPTSTRRRIEAALRQLEKTGQVTGDNVRLKLGTRLVRRWHGKAYNVLVLEDGFEHEGRRYVSLSQIARTITGAQWSGPRFFGLRKGVRPDG